MITCFLVYFINNNMSFNIDEERIKLIQVVNDVAFHYSEYVEGNVVESIVALPKSHVRFLWTVLKLTIKYPQVELYLKILLNYFTIEELEEITYKWSILHQMSNVPYEISLNAFEIIINHGVNINIQTNKGATAAHILMFAISNSHDYSILNLLIKYGANLNIRDKYDRTVLDAVAICQEKLNEETKNCIMLLVDFGAKTFNPQKKMILDFIEYYKNSTIKPAIKNKK